MLWYKSFLETRSRFLIGLVILLISVIGAVYAYPPIERMLAAVPTSGILGERTRLAKTQ